LKAGDSVEARWLLAEARAQRAEQLGADLHRWVEPLVTSLAIDGACSRWALDEAVAALRRFEEGRVVELRGLLRP
jgi:hypothetical protein